VRSYSFEALVEVSPAQLYAAIADVQRWPEWDPELDSIVHDGSLAPGAVFWLKPRGGPTVKMTVEQAKPAALFSDLAHLPLATMRTRHAF
jgi:hypothetical protein